MLICTPLPVAFRALIYLFWIVRSYFMSSNVQNFCTIFILISLKIVTTYLIFVAMQHRTQQTTLHSVLCLLWINTSLNFFGDLSFSRSSLGSDHTSLCSPCAQSVSLNRPWPWCCFTSFPSFDHFWRVLTTAGQKQSPSYPYPAPSAPNTSTCGEMVKHISDQCSFKEDIFTFIPFTHQWS